MRQDGRMPVQRQDDGRRAWLQGLLLAAAIVVPAAALWHAKSRPFDGDTLGIAIAELESAAAEGEVLAALDAGHALPAATRVAHAAQMRRQLDQLRARLRDKRAPATLGDARARATRIGDAVDAALASVARTAFDRSAIARFHALAADAGALKPAVDPE